MSKRYNALPIHNTVSKRPRIDVTPQPNGVQIHSSFKTSITTSMMTTAKPLVKIPSMSAFDDDNDELLVLVSSQLEKTVKTPAAMSDSFNSFAVGVEQKTSTQMFVQHSKNIPDTKFNAWDDDDDLLLSQFNLEENMAVMEKQKEQNRLAKANQASTSKAFEFKVPEPMDQSVILPSQMTISEEARLNLQQRRQKANELQLNFLQKHIDQLTTSKKKAEEKDFASEQKIKTLTAENMKFKYEEKRLKTIIESLRQEKLKDTEKSNKEQSALMSDLEKKLKTQELELEQKMSELMSLKMKKSNGVTITPEILVQPEIDLTDVYEMCQKLCIVPKPPMKLNYLVFKEIDPKRLIQKEICFKDYVPLTMGLSKLFITDTPNALIVKQIIPIVKSVFKQLYRYARRLKKTGKSELLKVPNAEMKNLTSSVAKNRPLELCEDHANRQPCIYDAVEMVQDEELLVARRCLAVIAEMCRCKIFVTVVLDDAMNFLKKMTLIVQIIGMSNDYPEYSPIVTAMLEIVMNVYRNSRTPRSMETDKLLFELVHAVVHCRYMCFVTLCQISKCLVVTAKDKLFLAYFCTKNSEILENGRKSEGVLKFTRRSCLLQIFGACLETCIQYNGRKVDASKIQMMAEILGNVTVLLTSAETLCVPWSFQTEDKSSACPCIPKVICGFVLLLNEVLMAFRCNHKILDKGTMRHVTQDAVMLLARIFDQYEQYEVDLLIYGSGSLMTVKSSYKSAISLINMYQEEFKFESSHEKALEILNNPKILMDFNQEDVEDAPMPPPDDDEDSKLDHFDNEEDYRSNY